MGEASRAAGTSAQPGSHLPEAELRGARPPGGRTGRRMTPSRRLGFGVTRCGAGVIVAV